MSDGHTSHKVGTYVTVTVTQLYNTEKNIEDSKTDNIIQHNNMLLTL